VGVLYGHHKYLYDTQNISCYQLMSNDNFSGNF